MRRFAPPIDRATQIGKYPTSNGGTFRFDQLRAGRYRLCVQVPGSAWLNPCQWGSKFLLFTLTPDQPMADASLVMQRGAAIPIRMEDSGQLLAKYEGKAAGAQLLVGVRTPASTFRPAVLTSQEATGRTLKVVIPFDRQVYLAVASSFFKLSDIAGKQFAGPGVAIPVFVPAGQTQAAVRLSVTGGK